MAYNKTGSNGWFQQMNLDETTNHPIRHHNKKKHNHLVTAATKTKLPALPPLTIPPIISDGGGIFTSTTSLPPQQLKNGTNNTSNTTNDNGTIILSTDNSTNTCYSTNQVLFVIGLTCFLNFAFILLIMVFVQCVGTSKKNRSDEDELMDNMSDYGNIDDAEQAEDNIDNWEHSRLRLASLPDNIITQSFAERYMASKLASLRGGSCYQPPEEGDVRNLTGSGMEFLYRQIPKVDDDDSEEEEFYYGATYDDANSRNALIDRRKMSDRCHRGNGNYYKLPVEDDLTFYAMDR